MDRRAFLKGMAATAIAAGVLDAKTVEAAYYPGRVQPYLDGNLQKVPVITAARGTEQFWKQVRNQFMIPPASKYIHMNTGTTGSQPIFSVNNLAVMNMYKSCDPRDWSANMRARYSWWTGYSTTTGAEIVARCYQANTNEIVLSYNTTDGANMWFSNTIFKAGDRLIGTNLEHGAFTGPMTCVRDKFGVQIVIVWVPAMFDASITVDEVVSWFEVEVAKPMPNAYNKQYLTISEFTYKNGLRLPIKEISAMCKKYPNTYTIVDAAHGAGHYPMKLHDYDCDFWMGAGHKWLCGGPGTGIFYAKYTGSAQTPEFMWQGGFGSLWTAPSTNYGIRRATSSMQGRGEYNTPAVLAMVDSLKFDEYIGIDAIYERCCMLSDYSKQLVMQKWGPTSLCVAPNPDQRFRTGFTSFNPFLWHTDPTKYAEMNTAIGQVLNFLAIPTEFSPKIYGRSVTWNAIPGATSDNFVGFRVAHQGKYQSKAEVDVWFDKIVRGIDLTGLPQL